MPFKEYNQDQPFLLPPSLHEFLPKGHLAHILNEVVNELDLRELYDRYNDLGSSAYHPQRMLKVLFYGYAVGERSSVKGEDKGQGRILDHVHCPQPEKDVERHEGYGEYLQVTATGTDRVGRQWQRGLALGLGLSRPLLAAKQEFLRKHGSVV
jgi:hypothetical protein